MLLFDVDVHGLGGQDNATARALYDKVAHFNGFVRYDYPLGGGRR